MRTHWIRAAAALALLMTAGSARAGEITWEKTLSGALATAKTTKKLVMVDFYTDWCGWCKKLDKDTYTNDQVVQLSTQFVPVKVNAEKEGVVAAKKYGVNGYPTILFLNGDGEVAGKIVGYRPPEGFADELKKISAAHRELPALESRVKANPSDPEATARLAAVYASRGNGEKANALLAQAEKADPQNTKGHLAKAYNALGDYYQEREQFERAIPLFRKAAKTGKQPYDLAYAHISIAVCYLQQQKTQQAIPELEATVAVPGAPKDLKEQAQQMLSQLRK